MKLSDKLFGNAAIYFGANILNAGIPFLLLPILTRVLTPADYGVVSMFGVFLSIASAFSGLSVHGAISVRYFQMDRDELANYIGACSVVLMISTMMVFLVALIAQTWLQSIFNLSVDWILTGVVISGLQFICNIQLSLWQASGKAIQYGTFQVSQSLLNVGVSLLLVLALGLSWEGRILGQVFSIVVLGAFSLWRLTRDSMLKISKSLPSHSLDALKFGIPLIPHIIGGLAMVAGDRLIVENLLGGGSVGIYMAAFQIASGLTILYSSFFKVWHPEITKLSIELNPLDRTILVHSIYKIIVYSFFLLIIYSLASWFAYPYIVGKSFVEGQMVSLVLAIASFFTACYYSTAIFISVANRNGLLALNTFLTGLIGLFASYYLCQIAGLIGVAMGVLLTSILAFLFCWYSSNVVYPMPWLKVLK